MAVLELHIMDVGRVEPLIKFEHIVSIEEHLGVTLL